MESPGMSGSGGFQQQYQPQQSYMMQPQPAMVQSQMGMGMMGRRLRPEEKCRCNAKAIAIIDIIVGVIYIILGIWYILVLDLLIDRFNKSPPHFRTKFESVRTRLYALFCFTIISVIVYAIDIGIAFGLCTSTNPTMLVPDALKRAKCWRCYNIAQLIIILVILILQILQAYYGNGDFSLDWVSVIFLGFKITGICIVQQFIRALQMALGAVAPMSMGGVPSTMMTTSVTVPMQNTYQLQQQYSPQYQ